MSDCVCERCGDDTYCSTCLPKKYAALKAEVERLRGIIERAPIDEMQAALESAPRLQSALDTANAHIEKLREALKPFEKRAGGYWHDDVPICNGCGYLDEHRSTNCPVHNALSATPQRALDDHRAKLYEQAATYFELVPEQVWTGEQIAEHLREVDIEEFLKERATSNQSEPSGKDER